MNRHFGGGLSVLEMDESNLDYRFTGGMDVRFGARSGRFGCSNNFAPLLSAPVGIPSLVADNAPPPTRRQPIRECGARGKRLWPTNKVLRMPRGEGAQCVSTLGGTVRQPTFILTHPRITASGNTRCLRDNFSCEFKLISDGKDLHPTIF